MAAEDVPFPLRPHLEVCRVWPAEFPGFGWGCRCSEDVPSGEEFMAVPVSKCFTAAAARSCPALASLGEDVLDCISEHSLMAFHMLVVKNQGAAAEDFLRECITEYTSTRIETLLDWPDDDVDTFLAGSKWSMVARVCKQDIEQEFEEYAEVIGEFFAANGIDAAGFLWAHRVLLSRSLTFYMEDGSMLTVLGGFSLFNHSVDVPTGSDSLQLRRSDSTGELLVTVRACRDYVAGEQAFFSYSDASNGRLLMMGGFVVKENPFDSVELMLSFPVTPSSLNCYLSLSQNLDAGLRTRGSAVAETTKAEFLETLPPDAEQPTEVALHVRLSQRALDAQLERVLAFFRLQSLCKGGAAPSAEALAADDAQPASRVQALKSLRAALLSMQQGYRHSLEEDQDALPGQESEAALGDPRAARALMAMRVLIGEKLVYRKAIEILDEKISAWEARVASASRKK